MKHLKLFFALFAMLALGVGNAWAEEVSLSDGTFANSKITWTAASGNITITQSKGSSGTAVSSSYVAAPRVYKGHILSFEAKEGYKIKQIDIKCNSTYYGNSMTAGTVINGTTVTNNTAEVNRSWTTSSNGTHVVSSVSPDGLSAIHIQNVATTNVQLRITAIEITYVEGTSTPTTQYTIKWHTAKGVTTDVTLNEGTTITKPSTDPTMTGYKFMGWTASCDVASDGSDFTAIEDFGTADSDKDFYAVFAVETTTSGGESTPTEVTDVLNRATTGITNTSYATWSGKTATSSAVYAGQSAGGNESIQLRTTNSNSGIVTTTSGGKAKKVTIVWNSNTTNGRTIDIYGKNSAYTQATDLYNSTNQGTKLGSIKYGTSTELAISGDYEYIGIRSNSGALYLTSVSITWASEGTSGGTTTYDNYITTCASGIEYVELGDAFKWSATEAEVTIDATDNEFPTLKNTHNVPVKYSSSDDAIATIAADGTVTLKKEGTVTITAKYEGGTSAGTGKEYKAKTVTYSLKVNKAIAQPTGTMYVKVTDAVTDGEYLIVYEAGNVAFNGALTALDAVSNTIAVEINSNTIAGNTEIDAATFTIASMTDGHSIQSKSGKYIGRTSNSNGMDTGNSAIANVITFSNGAVKIAGSGNGSTTSLQYNAASGQTRFRYFATTQKAIALYKKVDPNAVVEPVFQLAAGEYYGTQSVEITCATTGAEIYYTLNGTDPTSASTKYTGAISIASTTTVKAIAVKGANSSAVVSATYTILTPLATMQEIFDKATDATQSVHIKFNDWVISGVVPGKDEKPSSNAYITDGSKGFIIYTKDGHGFNVGDKLSGTVVCDLTRYNGSAEVVGLTSSTTGLSVTTGGVVTLVEVADESTLSGVNTGAVIKINGVCETKTINDKLYYYVDGVQLFNSLFAYENPTVGKKYNVTGVYVQYNEIPEILPRSAEDIEEVVDLPTATISIADITMEVGQEKAIEATITPDAAQSTVQYAITAGNEYITLNGTTIGTTITAVAAGTATITATVAEAAGEYYGATKTFNVTVKPQDIAELPFEFTGVRADIENTLGMSQDGLGTDYTAGVTTKLKFDGTGDWVIIHFNGQADKLDYDIKGNGFSGGKFTVQQSADGSAYTDVVTYTELGDAATKEHELAAESRYVKFIYTEKSSGNVGLGNIKITKFGEEPEQPGEGGGEGTEQPLTEWVLTSAADITINDLVVITMTKGETTWAMTNNNELSAPTASVVTLSANALASQPAENLKWVVANESGNITIYPYGGYESWLYCTNTNNGVKVGNNDSKIFTIDAESGYLKHEGTSRFIGVYNAQDWRCYTSINSNIEGQTLAFYVKKNANDVLPGTGEDPEGGEGGEDPVVPTPTINPTATFIFNTPEGLTNLGITYPTTADEDTEGAYKTDFEDGASYTQDDITMTTTNGGTPTRVWLTKNGDLDLRIYKNASLTLSVGKDLVISNVVFTGKGISNLKVDGVAVSNNSWAGSKQSVTFDVTATTNIYTIAITVSYTRSISANYGTICLPYGSSNYSGAEFYEFVGKETGKVWLASVDKLDAGVPYVFMVKGTRLTVAYEGTPVENPSDNNGLYGTFKDNTPVAEGNYIISQGKVLAPCGTGCYVNANRAYVVMEDIKGGKPTQQMPGRRYIGMDVQGENVETGVEDLFTTDAPVKVIENGQLIIIRDGVKYNVQGQKL